MRREREGLIMAKRRRFSGAFKRQVVEELLAGPATAAQLCRRYELCATVLGNWLTPSKSARTSSSAFRSWSGWWGSSPWRMLC